MTKKKTGKEVVKAEVALTLIQQMGFDPKDNDAAIMKIKADCLLVQAMKAHSDVVNKILSRATPKDRVEFFGPDTGKKAGLAYVQDDYMMEILTEAYGINGWRWGFTPEDPKDLNWEFIKSTGWVMLKGKLEVFTPAGWIQRCQFGTSEIKFDNSKKMLSPEIAFKGAATDAFKKCASMFGICNDVYTGKFSQNQAQKDREKVREGFTRPNFQKRLMMSLRKLGWYTDNNKDKAREYMRSKFPDKDWPTGIPSTKDLEDFEMEAAVIDLEAKVKSQGKENAGNGQHAPEEELTV